MWRRVYYGRLWRQNYFAPSSGSPSSFSFLLKLLLRSIYKRIVFLFLIVSLIIMAEGNIYIVANWSDNSTTIERSKKVFCSVLEKGVEVNQTVKNQMWKGAVDSIWGESFNNM